MRQSVILIGVCVLVLLGAWLGSRALLAGGAELTGPTPSTPVVPAQPQVPPAKGPALPADPPPTVAVAPEVADGGVPGAPSVVAAKTATGGALPDDATNPYVGESVELDYADKLMWEVDAGVERIISARDVYRRCLEMVPDLQRCKDGLNAAQLRLAPPRATVLQKGGPALRSSDVRKGFER